MRFITLILFLKINSSWLFILRICIKNVKTRDLFYTLFSRCIRIPASQAQCFNVLLKLIFNYIYRDKKLFQNKIKYRIPLNFSTAILKYMHFALQYYFCCKIFRVKGAFEYRKTRLLELVSALIKKSFMASPIWL